MEFKRPRHQQIGRSSRPNGICKKHPKHQQSPGVCSNCLSEKLSQLSLISSRSNNTTTTLDSSCSSSSLSSLSSMSSSHYSASASSCSSPVHRRHRYRMASANGRGFSMTFFKSGKNVLSKSRSLAFITRREVGEIVDTDHGKKKSSFWSKLLRPRSKRIDKGLDVHSRSMTRVH